MASWAIPVWALLVGISGLNLCAAGIVAILHIWRPQTRGRARIALSAAISGLFPTSLVLVTMFDELLYGSGTPVVLLTVGFLLFGGMVVSLPLAIIVSRKLDTAGDAFRTFE